jgi:hypothetical protein
MQKKTSRKLSFLYLMGIFLFGLYFLFADKIVSFPLKTEVQETKVNISDYKKDDVLLYISSCTSLGNVFDEISIVGAAFCESEFAVTDKKISIFFINEHQAYLYDTELAPRPDLPGPGSYNGFGATFTTTTMKDGIYDMYIYCKENDINYGIRYFNRAKKSSMGISFLGNKAVIRTDIVAPSNELLDCTVDHILLQSDSLSLYGWSIVPNVNNDTCEMFVSLNSASGKSVVFDAIEEERPDVVTALGNDYYLNSGFTSTINLSNLSPDIISLSIIKKIGDKLYDSMQFDIVKENYNVWRLVKKIDIPIPNNDLLFSDIDKAILQAETLSLYGWSFLPDVNNSPSETFIALIDSSGLSFVFDTVEQNRPDVANVFDNEYYLNSGFTAIIKRSDLPTDPVSLLIIKRLNDKIYGSARFDIIKDVPGEWTLQKSKTAFEVTLPAPQNESLLYNIDGLSVASETIYLCGWSFVPNIDNDTTETFIALTDASGVTTVFYAFESERPDVATAFERNDYLNSGFEATIKLSDLPQDLVSISIIKGINGELYGSEPIPVNLKELEKKETAS